MYENRLRKFQRLVDKATQELTDKSARMKKREAGKRVRFFNFPILLAVVGNNNSRKRGVRTYRKNRQWFWLLKKPGEVMGTRLNKKP